MRKPKEDRPFKTHGEAACRGCGLAYAGDECPDCGAPRVPEPPEDDIPPDLDDE